MQKFSFRLATLLKLRETVRDERRLSLAEAQRQDAEWAARQDAIQLELCDLRRDRTLAPAPGTVNLMRLRDTQRYEQVLRDEFEQLARRRRDLAPEIELRREALVAADAEVRALEKLRETGEARHQQAVDRAEIRRLDEAALRLAADRRT